jgi:hypothetical protein
MLQSHMQPADLIADLRGGLSAFDRASAPPD